jgi:hypothetical protein
MAASDPELIETLSRFQDENYHKLIRATSIFEAADSIEKELAWRQEHLSKDKMQTGVGYFPSTGKLVIYSVHFIIITWVTPLQKYGVFFGKIICKADL